MAIELSERSRELMDQYLKVIGHMTRFLPHTGTQIDSNQLIFWLSDEAETVLTEGLKDEDNEFILAALRAQLLHDIRVSLDDDTSTEEQADGTSTLWTNIKFACLAVAGALFAGCEGFDSITTMLGILSLPSFAVFLVGVGFSILSIIVFYSYDLVQVSKNLGVSLVEAPKLLDVYLKQMEEIKKIVDIIDAYILAELSLAELAHLNKMVIMLQNRFKCLSAASEQFDNTLHSSKIHIAKLIISGLVGTLFFGSGFFAGQSVAMFIAGLFISMVLPTFWPVLLFSVVVGAAAFSLYWYLEEVGVKKLVSRIFGLDEEKVEALCDKQALKKEAARLDALKEKTLSTTKLVRELALFKRQSKEAENEEIEVLQVTPTEVSSSQPSQRTSANRHAFYFNSNAAPELEPEALHVELQYFV